jgi:hypothetical protein
MDIEINLEDVGLDLLIVRKHLYNCNRFSVSSKQLITYMGVRTWTVYTGESTREGAAVVVAAST